MQTTKDKRPLSPHLQIYKLPLVSILSIMHRFTGVLLFLFFLLILWGSSLYIFFLDQSFVTLLNFIISETALNVIFIMMSCVFWFSLSYHLLNGVRHMLWDIGLGFSLQAVHITNLVILFSTLILTASALFLQLFIIADIITVL